MTLLSPVAFHRRHPGQIVDPRRDVTVSGRDCTVVRHRLADRARASGRFVVSSPGRMPLSSPCGFLTVIVIDVRCPRPVPAGPRAPLVSPLLAAAVPRPLFPPPTLACSVAAAAAAACLLWSSCVARLSMSPPGLSRRLAARHSQRTRKQSQHRSSYRDTRIMIVLLSFGLVASATSSDKPPMIYFLARRLERQFPILHRLEHRCSVRSIRSGVSVTYPCSQLPCRSARPAATGGVPVAQ